jgi:uncharacterized protein DUF3106
MSRLRTSAWIVLFALLTATLPALAQRGQGVPRGERKVGPHAGDWLRKNRNLPPAQQEKALENDPEFQKLPPGEKQELRERLHKFNGLTPQQQERRLSLMDRLEHMSPEQREHARNVMHGFRQLPPERKEAVRQAVRRLSGMSAQQQADALGSPQFHSQFSDEERGMMKSFLDLNVGPAFQPEDNPPATPPQ